MLKKKICWLFTILFAVISIAISGSMAGAQVTGDEEVFVSVAPDALILLDVTGSMDWNPIGTDDKYGTSSCAPDPVNCADYTYGGTTYCSGGYCSSGTLSARPNCNVNCSRMSIAKRAIFGILDDDGNNTINSQDSLSLGVRIGFMTFAGTDTSLNYASGNIILRQPISALGNYGSGTPYQTTYCGASKTGSCTLASSGTSSTVAGQSASGGTPLAYALREAKLYLDAHKNADTRAYTCRKKFVILISDGADTYVCGGSGAECQEHMYERRRQVVAAAKQLKDAGYAVYVIGFGANMPNYLKNTLNWMAYYGGTDNPDANNGNTGAYNIPLGCNPEGTAAEKALCCNFVTNPGACFPTGVTSCTADPATETADCYSGGSAVSTANFKATTNDPGYLDLDGYAFLASNTDQLIDALRTAIFEIASSSYSFTQSSIQTIRLEDENYLYEASFTPVLTPNNDSFWPGYLKRYTITDPKTGAISEPEDWDAGAILQTANAGDRKVYTLKSGVVTEFTDANFSLPSDFGITGGTAASREALRQLIINYIRGGEQGGTNVGRKLGDIFHSSPITIGTPNIFAYDKIDSNSAGFNAYRSAHERSTANGKRLIVVGANDAQFHVFKAANAADGGGTEVWSFIPPNFLTRLPSVAHSATHPTSCVHQYFVDGPTSGSDVWWGTTDQTAKSASDWHTFIVISEGRGGYTKLWSNSISCDTGTCGTVPGLCDSYSAASPHYCGYYAFDVTDTTSTVPDYKWKLGGSAGLSETHGKHMGEPWSKMSIGRVLYNGTEKWVGFIGGGYSAGDCTGGGTCDGKGKGFFVVDTQTGQILASMTHNGPAGTYDVVNGDMDYALAGQPALLDFDNDGFIDTAYIADIGGNIWRFKFCLRSETTCTQANWSGSRLFDATGNVRPVFTKPAIVWDEYGNNWVYFGTGDVTDPTASNAQERFYAIIDTSRTGMYTKSNLKDVNGTTKLFNLATDTTSGCSGGCHGWYMDMPGMGIKILHDPIVFFGQISFTTYEPSNSTNLCEKSGINYLYGLNYITGEGLYKDTNGDKSTKIRIDDGPPGGPQGSIDNVTGDFVIFVGKKGYPPPEDTNTGRSHLLYWRDRRVQ